MNLIFFLYINLTSLKERNGCTKMKNKEGKFTIGWLNYMSFWKMHGVEMICFCCFSLFALAASKD